MYAEHGQLELARESYIRSVEADPNYIMGLRNLGTVFMGLQDFEKGAIVFERLMNLEKPELDSAWKFISCLRESGRFEEALETLEALAEEHPQDARVWRELAMLYLNDFGDRHSAAQLVQRSLDLDPDQQDLALFLNPTPLPSLLPRLPEMPELSAP